MSWASKDGFAVVWTVQRVAALRSWARMCQVTAWFLRDGSTVIEGEGGTVTVPPHRPPEHDIEQEWRRNGAHL